MEQIISELYAALQSLEEAKTVINEQQEDIRELIAKFQMAEMPDD